MLAAAWPPVSSPPCWRGEPYGPVSFPLCWRGFAMPGAKEFSQMLWLPWRCRVAAAAAIVAQSRAAASSVTVTR